MTLSFLRPAIVALLAAASLASCGGKADFQIQGTVTNLQYAGLVLTESFSGQTLNVNDFSKNPAPFSFANSIEYGTEYAVLVKTSPPHQTCKPFGGTSGTAGRQAEINMVISCALTPHTVGGAISLAAGTTGSYVGLKLINGSNDLNPINISDAATAVYSYPDITYNMAYGITIFEQPTDQTIKCKLVPKVAQPKTDTPSMVSGTMGDADVVIDVVCAKV
jgi:hypothetical protein